MRADVAEIAVLGATLDGGPVVCGSCVTAWRGDLTRCPACCCALTGERGTGRARLIYAAQRRDDAPAPHAAEWPAWIAKVLADDARAAMLRAGG